MTLTKKKLRGLAKEARVLAMECVAGTAPRLGTGVLYRRDTRKPVCALGHLYFRVHGSARALPGMWELQYQEGWLLRVLEPVVEANNNATPKERHAAVVFPLLALADALEDASKTQKSIP